MMPWNHGFPGRLSYGPIDLPRFMMIYDDLPRFMMIYDQENNTNKCLGQCWDSYFSTMLRIWVDLYFGRGTYRLGLFEI